MEINIENYIPYLMNPRFDIKYENKNLNYSNEKKLVTNIDTLFFNFLNIIKHESINEFYDKNVEKNIKLKIVQKFEKIKYKKKDNIVQHISYEDEVNLTDISYLAYCYKLNFCYINYNIYVSLNVEDNTKPFYVIKKNKTIQIYNTQKIENLLTSNIFCIENPTKPLYSMSHYKVGELKQICENLSLNYDESLCKKLNYEAIMSYISSNLL